MRTWVAAVVLAGGLSASAVAQEAPAETPEAAHAFMAKIPLTFEVDDGNGWNVGYGEICYGTRGRDNWSCEKRNDRRPPYPVWNVRAAPGDVCTTLFSTSPVTRDQYLREAYTVPAGAGRFPTKEAADAVSLPWKAIPGVSVSGRTVTVAGTGMRFWLPTDALANRLGYAMEFLRLHCDPTAGGPF
jgi:hypothetical protein